MFFYDVTLFITILSGYVIVVVVSIEECLDTVPSEQHRVLPHLILIIVLPVRIRILRIEVIFLGWDERRLDFLTEELVPVVSLEPNMVFDFLGTVETESIDWFSLDQFIYEICGLQTPTRRHFILPDLNLL